MSDSTTEQPPVPAATDPVSADARKLQIALVDDDRNILTTVAIALQAEGFATRLYSDGETALKALLDNPPDLAVFDIKMPKMDGMELLRRLRAHSPLPVIFLTSKDDESDEEAGLELGADDYIAKPFSLRLLIARIRAILRRAEPLAAGAAPASPTEPAPATAASPATMAISMPLGMFVFTLLYGGMTVLAGVLALLTFAASRRHALDALLAGDETAQSLGMCWMRPADNRSRRPLYTPQSRSPREVGTRM